VLKDAFLSSTENALTSPLNHDSPPFYSDYMDAFMISHPRVAIVAKIKARRCSREVFFPVQNFDCASTKLMRSQALN
jgi:hypothetical protein